MERKILLQIDYVEDSENEYFTYTTNELSLLEVYSLIGYLETLKEELVYEAKMREDNDKEDREEKE